MFHVLLEHLCIFYFLQDWCFIPGICHGVLSRSTAEQICTWKSKQRKSGAELCPRGKLQLQQWSCMRDAATYSRKASNLCLVMNSAAHRAAEGKSLRLLWTEVPKSAAIKLKHVLLWVDWQTVKTETPATISRRRWSWIRRKLSLLLGLQKRDEIDPMFPVGL